MKTFKNEWTPQVWEGVGPVLPTAVQDALTYYQQLLIMVNAINETRDNADKLAEYTNTELNNIVDYLNERIRDFNTQMNEFFDRTDKAMNKFMQDETANREAFEAEMEAAFNQFTTDINNQWNEFKHTVEQWMDQMNSEWDAVKEAWEAVKAAWEQMKRDWEAFRNQMVSDFEQFKEEIRRLFNEYKNQTNEDLNAWKIATFNYFQGQYDSIKAALEAKLPDIVSNKLPAVLADYAGICLYYDPETRKINVGYDEGLARNGENKLIVTGGGGSGSGVTVKAGIGINVEINEQDHQATVSGKIAQASEIGMVKVGTGLEISEDGTLNATGGAGGDTVTAGVGIEITDVEGGSKQISVKKGSATELGAYRVGSGLEVDEAGVLQVKRWQPIDTTAAFEFFDKNIQPIGDTLELNLNYNAATYNSVAVYYRMQADSLAQLGRPNTVTVTDWVPDKQWTYDSTPGFRLSTNGLIGNATGAIEFDSTNPGGHGTIYSPIRNGHGNIVLMWNNKQNTVTLPFVVKGRDFILDQVHPISINGTPIAEGDTYSVTSFGNLNVSYNLTDGTVIQNSNVFWNDHTMIQLQGNPFGADISNSCVKINTTTGMLTTLNANSGAVAYKINKPYIGMDTPDIGPSTVVNFNINYDNLSSNPTIKLSQSTTKNFGTSIVGQIQWPGYTGSNFTVRVDNVNIAGLNEYNRNSIDVRVGDQFNIIPNRDGEVNITATPKDYIGATAQTKVVVTLDEASKPHIKVTTDSTQVADTQKDIANPATVDVGNLAKFSKSQGLITFWLSNNPQNSYFDDRDKAVLKIGSTVNNRFNAWLSPSMSYDFSTFNVGDKLSIHYDGNNWRGAYDIIFGEVVE